MIPKRIFTTWICDEGRDKYTERHREIFAVCLNSWLKLMPDYEIAIVTYGTLKTYQDAWLQDRLKEGNFIAASQWARYYFLQTMGGIYLDADVEAVKRFDDFLDAPFTCGHLGNGQQFANNAFMSAPARHQFTAELFRRLQQLGDLNHPDFGNISGPFMLTSVLNQYGWRGDDVDSIIQTAGGPVVIRRSKAFHPYSFNENFTRAHIESDTYAIHHWAASWKPVAEQTRQNWKSERVF